MATLAGCGKQEVSPLAYEYAKALYAISSRQDATRLAGVREQVDLSLVDGKLSEEEAALLTKLISRAEAGDWQKVTKSSRKVMKDQVVRSN